MFIGSAYRLREDREARSPTTLGYKKIVIKDRVLSHTNQGEGGDFTSYYYTLMCLVNDGDSAEISEDELQSEIIAGLYEFIYP